ncbi:MAG: UvrD-helicase domain-containing protein, partial [Gammaproteobacteria bacterium]
EQRRAVVTMDDNVLTVAAAGSGKTSVLVAKAGYAIKSGQYSPDQVLLLAFNRDAADELAERIVQFLGQSVSGADRIAVNTFHALGLSVIGQATGKTPQVAPWINQGQEIAQLVDIVRDLSKDPKFAENWTLFRTVYATSLSPIGAREEPEWWDRNTGRRGFLTYNGETVKSKEERMIANWLALKGIEYKYERPYQWRSPPARKTNYQPDFYYPSADVYHEHFALDQNGHPPAHFEGYAQGVAWKRKLHPEQGTTLIETTSYSIRQGDGFSALEQDLIKHGVKFDEVPLTSGQIKGASDDLHLLRTFRVFLSHVKSNRLSMDDLHKRSTSKPSDHPYRDALFLDLFEQLWWEWDRRLAAGNYVDFDDMLGKAADHLANGRCSLPYRLVLADEFQDTSRVRGVLLRELTRAGDTRLFVVGDDWQAVNRFAGADISLMRDFDKHFGHSTVLNLTRTFRCPKDISDVAGDFVMRNPYQIRKTVRSTNTRKPPGIVCYQLEDMDEQEALLRSHLVELAEELRTQTPSDRATAQILGRYNSDCPTNLSAIREAVANVIDLKWSTMHAAKGLEADYVFMVNVIEATKGMPSKIADDSTLWIAMPGSEDYPFAEERRLFYVALTRAKRRVTIYTDAKRRSEFIAELERDGSDIVIKGEKAVGEKRRKCPSCDSGVLVKR